jgi:DNA-binding transcriptional LysR family regulator
MDKLKQMESFVSVAQRGSLTAAAKAEGVAPAIIGRRLDGLESAWASSCWCVPLGA